MLAIGRNSASITHAKNFHIARKHFQKVIIMRFAERFVCSVYWLPCWKMSQRDMFSFLRELLSITAGRCPRLSGTV